MLVFEDELASSETTNIPSMVPKIHTYYNKGMTQDNFLPMASSLNAITLGKKQPTSDDIKIVGGRGYDLRQPIPIKYKTVRERFLAARKNFWLPNEIPMAEDKVQWNTGKLSESEMWLFKTNISYLTASDNLVPDNLMNAIMANITANEMRQYLRWQIAEESNHIESYLFILESFGLDEQGQGQIFSLYNEVPELANKLNWNLTFTNNVVSCQYPVGSRETIQCLLEDLISYYIFEFLFFPVGFSQIFALARNGKLRNTAQQYSYIWRDETMHAQNCLWLIRQIITENPSLWDTTLQQRVRSMVDEAVALETAHAKAAMPNGGIVGMSVNTYIDFAKFMADNVCRNLGLPPLFHIKSHPLPWISAYEMSHETNFFEGRVREYQIGGLSGW